MGKTRSPNRDKAFAIYKEHNGKITPKEIAEQLGDKIVNIYSWKKNDEWDVQLNGKVGAPKGNKNAIGNNGGAPSGNLNNLRHGLYCDETKRLPKEFIKKMFPIGLRKAYEETQNLELSKLAKLGHSIDILWAKILASQTITYVKNKKDMTKELKKQSDSDTSSTKEFEIQYAWDKENKNIDIQSKAMDRLSNMIKTYEDLLHTNWELTSEEQRVRVEKLKAELSKLNGTDNNKRQGNLDKLLEVFKQGPVK